MIMSEESKVKTKKTVRKRDYLAALLIVFMVLFLFRSNRVLMCENMQICYKTCESYSGTLPGIEVHRIDTILSCEDREAAINRHVMAKIGKWSGISKIKTFLRIQKEPIYQNDIEDFIDIQKNQKSLDLTPMQLKQMEPLKKSNEGAKEADINPQANLIKDYF